MIDYPKILVANCRCLVLYFLCLCLSKIVGPDSTIAELTDFICAAQMARASDALMGGLEEKVIIALSL